jgi:hypothetical protein
MICKTTVRHPVRAKTLSPYQHRAKRSFRIATSYRLAPLLKLPGETIGEFHSYAEYVNAGKVEGNPRISTLIPQPLVLTYQNKLYTPDAYEIEQGRRRVVELKPRGEFDASKQAAVEAYLEAHDIAFEVRANESLYENIWDAINWHAIVQQLVLYRDLDTDVAEQTIMRQWPETGVCRLDDWVDRNNREGTMYEEAALFRLAHRGWCQPDFHNQALGDSTEFIRCHNGAKP